MTLTVVNPFGTNYPDGSILPNNASGRQGEQLGADLHGKWYNANVRRNLYSFVLENVSLPLFPNIALTTGTNGLVSVCSLTNPASSGINAELVSTAVTHNNATTVVGTIGWFAFQNANAISLQTLTKGSNLVNYFSSRIGDTPNGQVIPYSAATFSSSAPNVLIYPVDLVANVGAATDANYNLVDKFHDGRIIIPPGQTVSLASMTAAMPSSNVQVVWAEWPFA